MLLHASAFGLYLLSVLILFAARTYYALTSKHYDLLILAIKITIWVDFISQFLLIGIFWDLGRPENTRQETWNSATSFSSIKIDEFDDDAELQARIWNRFQKGDRLDKSGLTVTSTSIMQLKASQASFISSSR